MMAFPGGTFSTADPSERKYRKYSDRVLLRRLFSYLLHKESSPVACDIVDCIESKICTDHNFNPRQIELGVDVVDRVLQFVSIRRDRF